MGLQKEGNSSGASYLNVANGKLVRAHKSAQEGVTVTRVNKNGKTVHEEHFTSISGYLKDAKIEENEYGRQWQFLIEDGLDHFIVCMGYSSRYATSLLKALPNVDLSKEVVLKPYQFTDKNDTSRQVSGITVYQDNVKILPAYTKEAPNGLPEMKKVRFKNEDKWDTEEMDNFLAAECAKKFAEANKQEATPVEADEDLPDFLK
jgi:hypothetical protein